MAHSGHSTLQLHGRYPEICMSNGVNVHTPANQNWELFPCLFALIHSNCWYSDWISLFLLLKRLTAFICSNPPSQRIPCHQSKSMKQCSCHIVPLTEVQVILYSLSLTLPKFFLCVFCIYLLENWNNAQTQSFFLKCFFKETEELPLWQTLENGQSNYMTITKNCIFLCKFY